MTLSLKINPEVENALNEKRAIVALESTVITHGLPYPQNIETAQAMETAVRQGGAVPATIAIIKGEVFIGLSSNQLEYLGQQSSESVRKCSRRSLPIAISQKENGATTVAGTMILAHMAGIPIFATGGIGGVHRGHPFDISADLHELGQTPIAVVSSGAKSILDLPATREVLETHGVPIIGFGTDDMPAFFYRQSGLAVDVRLDHPETVAQTILAHQKFGLKNGLLITVPVPEKDACEAQMIEKAIKQATKEANDKGIDGPKATPWLLSRLVTLTGGQSLKANRALLQNNGLVAAQIASAFANIT